MIWTRQVLAAASSERALSLLTSSVAGLSAVEVLGVRSLAAATELLAKRVPDLLITTLALDDGSGLELVEQIERSGLATPTILLADPSEVEGVPERWREQLLIGPVDRLALRQRIADELERRSPNARPAPFGVTDYLQLASFNRRSLTIEIHLDDGRDGQIVIVDGEAWAASISAAPGVTSATSARAMFGVDALGVLVTAAVAIIEVRELGERPSSREITTPTQMLLLDLARMQDEARRNEDAEISGVFALSEDDLEELELGDAPEPGRASEPELDGDEALRRLLTTLTKAESQPEPELLALAREHRTERAWLRTMGDARAIEDEPGAVLVGFAPEVGAALCARLADLGIPARCATAAEVAAGNTRPGLLVQRLEVEDEGPPFACFDLNWTLRTSGRACPWIVITDWPTRYTAPMCAALGAVAWYGVELYDADEGLAPEIAAWCHEPVGAAMPAQLGALDLVLMLVDSELDATVELRASDGARFGRIAINHGELWAAEFESVDGESLRGIDAATALCRAPAVEACVLAPIPTRERNLPRGLALALAALTRGLPVPTNLPSRAAQEHDTAMSSVNQVCASVVDDLSDALACGVIDLNTGMLMGVHHTVSYFTQSYLDAVAAAAVDMFRGKNVQRVEKLMSKHRGEEIRDAFEEIFISSPGVFHFMKLIRDKSAVIVLVTRKTTNQGMGWSTLRLAIDDISAALP